MQKRLHVIVSGIVQGVWFRSHTKQWADELGLKGFVRNLDDGRVEVIAEGEEEALRQLLGKLKKGPSTAKIENVEVNWQGATKRFPDFEIKRF